MVGDPAHRTYRRGRPDPCSIPAPTLNMLGHQQNAKAMLCLLMPAKNEALSIANVITSFSTACQVITSRVCILVLDDGSTDETRHKAEASSSLVEVVQVTGGGLANAFRQGVSEGLARGADAFLHVDSDGQYLARDLPAMWDAFARGSHLVLGNRLWRQPDGMGDVRFTWNRRLSEIFSLMAGLPIQDTQTGYRLFDKTAAAHSQISAQFTYTQEQVVRVARAGLGVSEVPITFVPRAFGKSRLVNSPLDYMARVFDDAERLRLELGISTEGWM